MWQCTLQCVHTAHTFLPTKKCFQPPISLRSLHYHCVPFILYFSVSSHSSALLSTTVRWWWYKRTFTRTTGGTDTRHWCTVKMFRNKSKNNTEECAAVHMHWTNRSINTQPFDRSQKLLIVERSQCSTAAVSILYILKWNRLFNYYFFRIFFLYIDSIDSKKRGENDLI